MQINLKGTNIELTAEIYDYIIKRVTNLEKLLAKLEGKGAEAMINFEVAKKTNHHKSGVVFHADCLAKIEGREFYSSADKEDLFQAIDAVKENLFREISKNKDRRQTLFKRGAASIKKIGRAHV